jgi:hypothetical protein
MKTRSLVLTGAVALTLGACATWGLHHGGVDIDDTYVEIHPGTHFSPDDTKALNKILSEYDRRLYWVANVNGPKITDSGKLSYVYVANILLDEVEKAATAGTSYSVIQIGARDHSPHVPDHSPHVPDHSPHIPMMSEHSPHPTSILNREDYRKCTELVKRVTPILQKYSQK